MAIPSGTFSAHTAVGQREDLEDIIYDISPTDTPFISNADRESADAVTYEWQTDSLAAAASNAQVEGNDAVINTATPTTRMKNICQLSWKVPSVTGTVRAVSTAGRRDEYSYQMFKRSKELKRDIEKHALSEKGAATGATATAREACGVMPFLYDNQEATSTSFSSTSPAAFPITDDSPQNTSASVSAITETRFKAVIKKCWDDGGDAALVLCDSTQKETLSGFTGIATQYKDNPQTGPATILGAADAYVSDFGTHYIVADRFMPGGTVYALDMEYWALGYLRPFQQTPLAKTGDSDKGMVLAEWTVVARNPKSSGKIVGGAAY